MLPPGVCERGVGDRSCSDTVFGTKKQTKKKRFHFIAWVLASNQKAKGRSLIRAGDPSTQYITQRALYTFRTCIRFTPNQGIALGRYLHTSCCVLIWTTRTGSEPMWSAKPLPSRKRLLRSRTDFDRVSPEPSKMDASDVRHVRLAHAAYCQAFQLRRSSDFFRAGTRQPCIGSSDLLSIHFTQDSHSRVCQLVRRTVCRVGRVRNKLENRRHVSELDSKSDACRGRSVS